MRRNNVLLLAIAALAFLIGFIFVLTSSRLADFYYAQMTVGND